jgi:tetratricopeptide (TPR) repeat protein
MDVSDDLPTPPIVSTDDHALLTALTGESTARERKEGAKLPTGASPAFARLEVERPPQRSLQRKARRWPLPMVIIFLLLMTGTAVFVWQRREAREAGREAIAKAASAKRLGTYEAFLQAATSLARARTRWIPSPDLVAEQEFLASLFWLEYATGEPPRLTQSKELPAAALAQAALLLVDGEIWRARSLLAGVPPEETNQGVRFYLLAWSYWLEGKQGQAQELLDRALERVPRLAAAHVLRGHILWELGEGSKAEISYRAALAVSPSHELAVLGLTAVLLSRDHFTAEVDELLARVPKSALGQAWRRLMIFEHRFLKGDASATIKEIRLVLTEAPSNPVLLFHGVRVLLDLGYYDEAKALLGRLKKIRSDKDPALHLLEAELDCAQGIEPAAVVKLRGDLQHPASRRLYALALLLDGMIGDARNVLAEDVSTEAMPYRLFAVALADKGSSLEELRELARHSLAAKLALAHSLLERGELKAATETADELATHPRFRRRALALIAQIQLGENRIKEVMATVKELVPGFWPGAEVLGRFYLRVGRAAEASQILADGYHAGRKTLSLLVSLAQAYALAGKTIEATQIAEEAKARGASETQRHLLHDYLQLVEKKLPSGLADQRTSTDPIYLAAVGQLYVSLGRFKEAEEMLKAAQAADPSYSIPYLGLGMIYSAQKKPNAVSYFEDAITRATKKPYDSPAVQAKAHLEVARALLAEGKTGEPIMIHLRRAQELEPNNAEAHRFLGETYIAQRQWHEAQQALEKSVSLNPEEATAFFLLGVSSRAKPERARRALQRFLELEPQGKRAAIARRTLKKIR